MAYSLMAIFKDCMAARDAVQQSSANEDAANVDLSPLRVRGYV
jgi:hypothetical protein